MPGPLVAAQNIREAQAAWPQATRSLPYGALTRTWKNIFPEPMGTWKVRRLPVSATGLGTAVQLPAWRVSPALRDSWPKRLRPSV